MDTKVLESLIKKVSEFYPNRGVSVDVSLQHTTPYVVFGTVVPAKIITVYTLWINSFRVSRAC
jgi:hypothetical protein